MHERWRGTGPRPTVTRAFFVRQRGGVFFHRRAGACPPPSQPHRNPVARGPVPRDRSMAGDRPLPYGIRPTSSTAPQSVQPHLPRVRESDLVSDSESDAPRLTVPNRRDRGHAPAPYRRRKTPPCKQRHSARRAPLRHSHRAYCTICRSLSRRALQ